MKIFLMIFLLIPSLNSAYSSATFYQISQNDVSEVNKLYENLNGENWVNRDGWPVSSGTFSVDYLPDGIVVELGEVISSSTVSMVYLANITGINFNKNNLIGEIPNLNLPKLKSIDLSNDKLSGKIPNFNLPELLKLDFHDNKLSGVIPNFDLPKLKYLILYANQLSGEIPNFNLPKLDFMYLYANQLSGDIPRFSLANYATVILMNNKLNGKIPDFEGDSLGELDLRWNKFTFEELEINTGYPFNHVHEPLKYKYAPQNTMLPIEFKFNKIFVTVDGSKNNYTWFLDLNEIKTTEVGFLSPSGDGVYRCEVRNPILPYLTLYSDTISFVNTGIENENNKNNVRIIQTNEQINISTNGKYFGSEMKIFNNIGEIIYSGKILNSDESVDVSGFATGGYNFVLMNENRIIKSRKFVIVK